MSWVYNFGFGRVLGLEFLVLQVATLVVSRYVGW